MFLSCKSNSSNDNCIYVQRAYLQVLSVAAGHRGARAGGPGQGVGPGRRGGDAQRLGGNGRGGRQRAAAKRNEVSTSTGGDGSAG